MVGAPRVGGVTVKEASSTSVELSATGVSAAGSEVTYRYGLSPGSSSGGKCTQTGRTFTGLESHGFYTPLVCISTKYGTAQAEGEQFQLGGGLPALTGQTYRVSNEPKLRDGSFVYGLVHNNPAKPTIKGEDVWVEYSTGPTISLDSATRSNSIEVRQCKKVGGQSLCSKWAAVKPEQSSAPTTVVLKQLPECAIPGDKSTAKAAVGVSEAAAPYVEVEEPDDQGKFLVSFTGPFSTLESKPFSSALCPDSTPQEDDS